MSRKGDGLTVEARERLLTDAQNVAELRRFDAGERAVVFRVGRRAGARWAVGVVLLVGLEGFVSRSWASVGLVGVFGLGMLVAGVLLAVGRALRELRAKRSALFVEGVA